MTTFENDILFDDNAILENAFGKAYLTVTAENISPDCNCSGYTELPNSYGDCNN